MIHPHTSEFFLMIGILNSILTTFFFIKYNFLVVPITHQDSIFFLEQFLPVRQMYMHRSTHRRHCNRTIISKFLKLVHSMISDRKVGGWGTIRINTIYWNF